jgi:hypothetical protein
MSFAGRPSRIVLTFRRAPIDQSDNRGERNSETPLEKDCHYLDAGGEQRRREQVTADCFESNL